MIPPYIQVRAFDGTPFLDWALTCVFLGFPAGAIVGGSLVKAGTFPVRRMMLASALILLCFCILFAARAISTPRPFYAYTFGIDEANLVPVGAEYRTRDGTACAPAGWLWRLRRRVAELPAVRDALGHTETVYVRHDEAAGFFCCPKLTKPSMFKLPGWPQTLAMYYLVETVGTDLGVAAIATIMRTIAKAGIRSSLGSSEATEKVRCCVCVYIWVSAGS